MISIKKQKRAQDASDKIKPSNGQKSVIGITKEVEKTLVDIYKKAITRDHTKMEWLHFIDALQMIAHEFISKYSEENLGL